MPLSGGALKKVSGVEIVAGGAPGRRTSALPIPSPTIAPAQRLRATGGVVPASFATVQTGRPLVSIEPCLSKMKVSSFSAGGCEPSVVLIRVTLSTSTGAFPRAGRARGEMPAVALTIVSSISIFSA